MSTPARRFDFVVVGAGSSGAVAARRLVDRFGEDVTVLLLEAGGPDSNPAIHEPVRMPETLGSADDWSYVTTPQAGAAGRQLWWPRGKVLGGSSSLNGMIWVHGAPADYDHWAYLGNEGWAWEDVLPVFRAIEDFDGGASEHHGTGGYMHITSRYPRLSSHEAIVAAAQEVGIAFNPDYNGPEIDGVSYIQYNIKDGERLNTARAYLHTLPGDPRLVVETGSQVRRLLFAGDRCTGVELVRDGRPERVEAACEVVVCAGAIGSPQLLMLSGIGPTDELRRLGIAPRLHLPGVGENLHDHLQVPVILAASRPLDPVPPGGSTVQTHLFWRSRSGLVAPDVQPIHYAGGIYFFNDWMSGPADALTLGAGLIRPLSRGTIRLTGATPEAPMLLDPAVLQCQADVDTILAATELCREIGAAPALREWGATELYPGPDVRSRADLVDFIRRSVFTYHHQVGTCRMGRDPLAVVDARLRVHGIAGLRVADASVMPVVPSGNTNAPCVMVGERVAAFIAEDHGGQVTRTAHAVAGEMEVAR